MGTAQIIITIAEFIAQAWNLLPYSLHIHIQLNDHLPIIVDSKYLLIQTNPPLPIDSHHLFFGSNLIILQEHYPNYLHTGLFPVQTFPLPCRSLSGCKDQRSTEAHWQWQFNREDPQSPKW